MKLIFGTLGIIILTIDIFFYPVSPETWIVGMFLVAGYIYSQK
ncbi:MAG: hypothetical protein U9R08_02780 [Nanoarchaeota archaeon]|nr:hypothetical protein [Nanoarchaeota archaeon]